MEEFYGLNGNGSRDEYNNWGSAVSNNQGQTTLITDITRVVDL